jgi:hypothetical protein
MMMMAVTTAVGVGREERVRRRRAVVYGRQLV